jgi:hypothetical protein
MRAERPPGLLKIFKIAYQYLPAIEVDEIGFL